MEPLQGGISERLIQNLDRMLHGNRESRPPKCGLELQAAAQVGGHDPVREGVGQGVEECRGKAVAPFGTVEKIASGTSTTTQRQFEREQDGLANVSEQSFCSAGVVDLAGLRTGDMNRDPLAFGESGWGSFGPCPDEEGSEFEDVIGEPPGLLPAPAVCDQQGDRGIQAGAGLLPLSCRAGFLTTMPGERPTAKRAFRNLDRVPPAGENPGCGAV